MTDPAISCRNVWKVFGPRPEAALAALQNSAEAALPGYVTAVRDVTLDIMPGEMLVVMGLSGSGKSTLLRCLSRLNEVTSGEILIEGRDIGGMNELELIDLRRRKMGMVFQSFGLLPKRNALENVAFPLEMRGQSRASRIERAREMLALVGLAGRESYFPHELSGGQQQRVGIARSLAVEPDIWFLDEPFSALDPLIRREMQDEFLRLKALLKKTIVFVTHDFDEALRLADRIAIMKDGRVEQCARPDQIVLSPATDYIARFTADIDRARVLRTGGLAQPINGHSLDGPTVAGDQTLRAIGRLLANDRRDWIPVSNDKGQVTGVLDRSKALDILLGSDA